MKDKIKVKGLPLDLPKEKKDTERSPIYHNDFYTKMNYLQNSLNFWVMTKIHRDLEYNGEIISFETWKECIEESDSEIRFYKTELYNFENNHLPVYQVPDYKHKD